MKVINLFGPPGVGKSTVAAGVFSLLKRRGVECELVTEYAKALVWSGRTKTLQDQLYVFAKQNNTLMALRDHEIEFVVTDSPLFMNLAYQPKNYYEKYPLLVLDVFNSYNNVNFFLSRSHRYSRIGRNQDENEANELAIRIKDLLDSFSLPYKELPSNAKTPEVILEHLGVLDGQGTK